MKEESSSALLAEGAMGSAPTLDTQAFRAFCDIFSDPCLLIDAMGRVVEANRAARDLLRDSLPPLPCPMGALFSDGPGRIGAYLANGSRTTHPIPGRLTLRSSKDQDAKVRCSIARLSGGGPGLVLRFARVLPIVERFQAFTREVERGRRLAYELRRDHGVMGEKMRRAEQAAQTDPLTGLGNRAAFDQTLRTLEHLRTTGPRRQDDPNDPKGADYVAVVIDMDGLKRINDSRGHGEGDRVLSATAQGLVNRLRGMDTCFRIGGDEFVVLARAEAQPYAKRFTTIVAEVTATLHDRGFPEAGLSWGLASRGEVEQMEALLPLADSRMYIHKKTRGGRRDRGEAQPQRSPSATSMPLRKGDRT